MTAQPHRPPAHGKNCKKRKTKFKESCKQLQGSGYSIVGGKDVSYLIAEKEIIKCIEAELRDIEKIRKNPLAAKVVLGLDTVSRDNITDDTPLELLAAEEFSRAQVILCRPNKSNAGRKKMREELKFRTDACRNIMEKSEKMTPKRACLSTEPFFNPASPAPSTP